MRIVEPIVRYRDGRALVDRASLARLSGRKARTIRAHCPVVEYRNGRALYDAEQCREILDTIPARNTVPRCNESDELVMSGLSG